MGDVFQDRVGTAAVLYRLVHHSRIVLITGNSYRMKDYKLESEQRSKKKNRMIHCDWPEKTGYRKPDIIAYNYREEAV